MLSIAPELPPPGTVEIEFTRRSTGKTAVVEFHLDPEAAGDGCFVA